MQEADYEVIVTENGFARVEQKYYAEDTRDPVYTLVRYEELVENPNG